jgi:hypothetical protein
MLTHLKGRDDKDPVKLVDAAYWVKGCSSLGRLRCAALARIGSGNATEFCLVDLKEAVPAAAPRNKRTNMPRDNAERVVTGAQALSPNLGERMLAARLLDKAVVVRELMPQDIKLDIEHLNREDAMTIAHYLAGVVGRAHGRQLDKAKRQEWLADLSKNHTKSLEAPSWLWSALSNCFRSTRSRISNTAGGLRLSKPLNDPHVCRPRLCSRAFLKGHGVTFGNNVGAEDGVLAHEDFVGRSTSRRSEGRGRRSPCKSAAVRRAGLRPWDLPLHASSRRATWSTCATTRAVCSTRRSLCRTAFLERGEIVSTRGRDAARRPYQGRADDRADRRRVGLGRGKSWPAPCRTTVAQR